jgi:hypothetical protein
MFEEDKKPAVNWYCVSVDIHGIKTVAPKGHLKAGWDDVIKGGVP